MCRPAGAYPLPDPRVCRQSVVRGVALADDRVDLAAGVLVFDPLKKRQAGIYRAVPVSPASLDELDLVHGIRELHARRGKGRGIRLWPWSRIDWLARRRAVRSQGYR